MATRNAEHQKQKQEVEKKCQKKIAELEVYFERRSPQIS
jgi:hypothetical protein